MTTTDSSFLAEVVADGANARVVVASVFTPYQLLFFERIWPMFGARPLLLVDTRPPHIRVRRAPLLPDATVLPLDIDGSVNYRRQAVLIEEAWAAIEGFVRGRDFLFVHGSLQWPLNNVIYSRSRRLDGFRLIQIDDGLSTYLDLTPSRRERFRNLGREGAAIVRGFPRRTFLHGHPLGHDVPDLSSLLAGIEPTAHAKRGRPFRVVPLDASIHVTPDRTAALFVGQPYGEHYGHECIRRVAAHVLSDLRQRGFVRIAFKPHHFQAPDDVALWIDAGFELCDSPVTVEELVEHAAFGAIASINSTALLTVKALFGAQVDALAYGADEFAPRHEDRRRGEVADLFRHAGVVLLPVRVSSPRR